MSLSTWPGANITSSPGFQLAGTALAAGAALVQPARIPGYRFLRPLKVKIAAGVAIVAVLGVVLLSGSTDTNISIHDAALEDSVTRMSQQPPDRAVWQEDGIDLGADYSYPVEDLDNATVGNARLFEISRDKLMTWLSLDTLYSIAHKTISEHLKHLDARVHKFSGLEDCADDWSLSYLKDLDNLYHNLDDRGVFNWSTYEIISMLLFIRLCFGIVKRLYRFFFNRRAPVTSRTEVSVISDYVFAEPTARVERYVLALDATLRLFATVSLERDGRLHSTGYIFDMYDDGLHTGRLFVQQFALPDAVKSEGFWSFVQLLRRCCHAVVSFVVMIQNLVVSPFAWCRGKLKTEKKAQHEAHHKTLDQSFFDGGNTSQDESSSALPGFSDNGLMGLDVTGIVNVNDSSPYRPYHVLSDPEWPPSPDSRGSFHSVLSTPHDDCILVQPGSENITGKVQEIAQVECTDPATDSDDGGSSTEKLLRGATRAVDELLSSANDSDDGDKSNNELYKSMRIVKHLLAALSGQIAALDIPEDDYSRYPSGLSDLDQSEDDQSRSGLALIANTQSGFTYECTSHGDDDCLTLKFTARDGDNEPSSSVPSGELSLIRKKDGPQAGGSCTTVIATGPIFSPPYVQPPDPDAPIFVVVPGFRRHRKRPKNRSRGKGRAKHTKEAEDSTDSE